MNYAWKHWCFVSLLRCKESNNIDVPNDFADFVVSEMEKEQLTTI